MKFLLISPKNRTTYNFRGDLIKAIKAQGYEVLVTGPDKTDVEKIETLGARFIEISLNKTGTSVKADLDYLKALTKLMKEEQPDATLGYTSKPVIYGSIAAKRAGVKSINCMVTGGGYTFTSKTVKAKLLGIIVRNLYRISLCKSNHVIFQNKDDLKEFCDKKLVKKEKCYVVNGSGVNMEKFMPQDYPKETTFFMLSRLLKSKGVMEYLKAAEIVKKEYPNTKFYLLGKYEDSMQDGIDKNIIKEYEDKQIVERFEETDNVVPYYQKASVYVLPSYREGTPRTVLEAMACARPIITTDTNGCRDTVIDGKNGFIVPVKDVDALAKAMKKFIENPELIKTMGLESLEYCKEKFDVNKVNKDMLNIMNIR